MPNRIRVNYSTSEFEVEGDEKFVERHSDRLEAAFTQGRARSTGVPEPAGQVQFVGELSTSADNSFGEAMQQLPSTAGTDRFLLGGSFIQRSDPDKLFTTREVNALLKEQGVRLGNPSQTAANLLKAKLVFREKGKLRVSQLGERRLRELRNS